MTRLTTEQQHGPGHPKPSPPAGAGGLLRYLPALTLVAVLTLTASAEFGLARTVLDLPPHIAWALPVAVDSYVLVAMRSGRDVAAALSVMAGALAASTVAHLAASNTGEPLPPIVVAPAATVIMTVLVVVAWRVHVLIDLADKDRLAALTPAPSEPRPAAKAVTGPEPIAATAADLPGVAEGPANRTPRPSTPSTHPARQPGKPLGNSDQSIAAAITADLALSDQPEADLPSIRALMRTYAIGQKRATRIHQTVRNTTATKPQHDQNSASTEIFEESDSTNAETHDEEFQRESASKAEAITHTCITDRVGPSSPTGKASAAHSSAAEDVTGEPVSA